mmetsp:Transcript_37317/g.87278  ORF Transcript_37317/g.87278 Transcript_37317/m.87278 type:complete len:225 (+) Transcript_37317:50-724(+)
MIRSGPHFSVFSSARLGVETRHSPLAGGGTDHWSRSGPAILCNWHRGLPRCHRPLHSHAALPDLGHRLNTPLQPPSCAGPALRIFVLVLVPHAPIRERLVLLDEVLVQRVRLMPRARRQHGHHARLACLGQHLSRDAHLHRVPRPHRHPRLSSPQSICPVSPSHTLHARVRDDAPRQLSIAQRLRIELEPQRLRVSVAARAHRVVSRRRRVRVAVGVASRVADP